MESQAAAEILSARRNVLLVGFSHCGNAFVPSHLPRLRGTWLGLWVQSRDTEKVKMWSLCLTWFLLNILRWLSTLPSEYIPSSACRLLSGPHISLWDHSLPLVAAAPSPTATLSALPSQIPHTPGLAVPSSWNALLPLFLPLLLIIPLTWLIPTHPWKLESCFLQKPSGLAEGPPLCFLQIFELSSVT